MLETTASSLLHGDYILFVDSDDYIEKNLISSLYKYMQENLDIIKFKLKRVDENGNIIEKVDGRVFEKLSGEEAFANLFSTDNLLDSACIYLFRRDYYLKNNYQFKVGMYHEDFGLVPLIIINADSVTSVNYYGYNYVQIKNSITRNTDYKKTLKRMNDVLIHYDNMVENIYNLSDTAKENIKIYYTNAIILKLKELNQEDQNAFIKEIKSRKMIKNIKIRNFKQLIKRIMLTINIKLYLKMR